MTAEDFGKLVEEGIRVIPASYLARLKNVRIVVEDRPTKEQLAKAKVRAGWTLFGLYEGVPQSGRGGGYTLVLPDKITIFRQPIEEACHSEEEIRDQVMLTVWHEIAHHFGLNEDEVRRREARRKKR